MTITEPLRSATLEEAVELLTEQQARKLDVVAPASTIRADLGRVVISGAEAQLDLNGVTDVDGVYRPTPVCLEGVAAKLNVPTSYLKRCHDERPDIFDANVNGWLHGSDRPLPGAETPIPNLADDRSFLVRCFQANDDGDGGIARAFLSDSYKPIDHLDSLTACLEGIHEAGIDVSFGGCDITERRMRVRVVAPDVAALAPVLLGGYRSPFDGADEARRERMRRHGFLDRGDEQTVFAGFDLTNSETGGGAFTITPVLIVKVCLNGLTITADALRSVHLGARLDDGLIRWSDDTRRQTVDLVRSQTRDAVSTFLDVEYVQAKVAEMEAKAGVEVEDPQATVERVTSQLRIPESHRTTVLSHFIRGGQTTAGGIMQAVSSAAQEIDDPDTAAEVEAQALPALALAAS